jgi:hypothetical protein
MSERVEGSMSFSVPTESGGTAFPVDEHEPGMTLRDWFAGHALAGVIAKGPLSVENRYRVTAAEAYKYADAMIAVKRVREG